jgi:hypothetical protein
MALIERLTEEILSTKEKVNLEKYYDEWKGLDEKYMERIFSMSLLTIYEYSSSYWENYYEQRMGGELRFRALPAVLIGIALVDLGGSYVAGMIWIYDNISCVECGNPDDFLGALGYAAVSVSSGMLGPLVDRIFFPEE